MAATDAIAMARYGMTLCAFGDRRGDAAARHRPRTRWLRTPIATAAVQNLLGGDETMKRSRKPEVYADAAYAVLSRPARGYTGNTLLCEDVLLEAGVTDLSVYDCVPGFELGVDFWVDSPNPPGYPAQ